MSLAEDVDTTTSLGLYELEDPAVGCDNWIPDEDCPNEAKWLAITTCGCDFAMCDSCRTKQDNYVKNPPWMLTIMGPLKLRCNRCQSSPIEYRWEPLK